MKYKDKMLDIRPLICFRVTTYYDPPTGEMPGSAT